MSPCLLLIVLANFLIIFSPLSCYKQVGCEGPGSSSATGAGVHREVVLSVRSSFADMCAGVFLRQDRSLQGDESGEKGMLEDVSANATNNFMQQQQLQQQQQQHQQHSQQQQQQLQQVHQQQQHQQQQQQQQMVQQQQQMGSNAASIPIGQGIPGGK